ncbi:hypothetical protein MVEN_01592500 [Mycena venus]|uniref:MYND-type domain-containing protein n=1 Tax=Mycena venus TaxID=2733690 RepID=A0A8H6XSN7_9AGAR|nr:hypothetical protein MVEN_01592500 [Mycena venus]
MLLTLTTVTHRNGRVVVVGADTLFEEKKYKDACMEYIKGAVAMLGRDLPANGPYNFPEYERLAPHWQMSDTMACLNGAAESLVHLRQYKQALWLASEVEVIVRNVQIEKTRKNPLFEWFDFEIQFPEYYLQRLRARVLQEQVFRKLGNTAAANERRLQATALVPKHLVIPEMREIHLIIPNDPVFKLRHPDPELVATLVVTEPTLQVLGSWQKVPLKKGGHLYILGGEKHLRGPFHRDFWRINLTSLDDWEPLPSYPVPVSVTENISSYSMTVVGSCAYLFTGFTGRPDIDIFNLRTRTWTSIRTSMAIDGEAWPYPSSNILDYSMQSVGQTIYVFGGSHDDSPLGCTLLVALDVPTLRWTRLSGSAFARIASYDGPGPRRRACSWVGKNGKDGNMTFFVMYGEANRQGALLAGMPHGASNSFSHEDLWGWDTKAGGWTQRRLLGNVPSPRMEMACTYNPVLDRVITFGGFAPSIPSLVGPGFGFSYYGDTFILGSDPPSSAATPSWTHVLAQGFPTYRAQAHLASDPHSGRTFLFGGYVNSWYIPSKSESEHTSRVFGDLWELRLDVPGGGFAAVDVEDAARTARVGPWQRCFACGSVGPWKKCGGACNGQAFFCDARCLRDGWQEHKVKHKCRK